MTDSALIVFLPLVGAVVGAVFGAFANGLYRDWQDKKARDREREGLMLLIGAEIAGHQEAFKDAHIRKGILGRNTFSTEVWDESRVRLAQLLSTDHMTAVTRYYAELVKVRDNAARLKQLEWQNPGLMASEIRYAWQFGDIILDITNEHISDSAFHAVMGADRYDLFESSEEARPT
jgi:hypothetical protein